MTTLDQALRVTIGDRSTILLRDALDAPIPAGVKRHLLADVVALIETDLAGAPRLRQALGGAERVRQSREGILSGLAPLCELGREEYARLLSEAVGFTESYLVCPRETIRRVLIGTKPAVTIGMVRSFFSRTADYGYFPRLIEEVLRRRGVDSLSAGELRTVVARIDDHVTRGNTPPEMARMATPIFDLLLARPSGEDDPIPLEPILRFLADKQMTIIGEYIGRIAELRSLTTITRAELAGYLADLETRGSEDVRSAEEPPPEGEAFAEMPVEPATVAPTEEPNGSAPAGASSGGATFFLPDLRQMVDEKDRQRFIRQVFRKDQAYFAGVIGTLNTFLTWPEAAAYLQQVYDANRLDPFNREVVAFTDLVHRRFIAGGRTE